MASPPKRQPNTPRNRVRPDEDGPPPVVTISKSAPPEPTLPLERLGDLLRRVREQRGDDLQQIADYLCIRRNFLVALENSKYDEFPADAYVIGFLRSYAGYLGVDSKEAVDRYRNEMAGRRKKPALLLPTPISEGRTPSVFIMIGAAVAALLIYILWYGLSTSDRAAVSTPQVLPSTAQTETTANAMTAPSTIVAPPATEITPPITAAPVTTPAGQPSGDTATRAPHLVIRAEQSSWILITDNKGRTVFDRVMKPGESYKVPDGEGLMLTTGNGGGIVLSLDGVDLPKLSGGSSHAVRNVSLTPEHLRALPPTPDY